MKTTLITLLVAQSGILYAADLSESSLSPEQILAEESSHSEIMQNGLDWSSWFLASFSSLQIECEVDSRWRLGFADFQAEELASLIRSEIEDGGIDCIVSGRGD